MILESDTSMKNELFEEAIKTLAIKEVDPLTNQVSYNITYRYSKEIVDITNPTAPPTLVKPPPKKRLSQTKRARQRPNMAICTPAGVFATIHLAAAHHNITVSAMYSRIATSKNGAWKYYYVAENNE